MHNPHRPVLVGVAGMGGYAAVIRREILRAMKLHDPPVKLAAGKAVMCEKPPAGSVDDLDAMIAARNREKLPCAVAYQDIDHPATFLLKQRILAGSIGKLRSPSVMACWPRDDKYYGRNTWAGRIRCGAIGVMDSPAINGDSEAVPVRNVPDRFIERAPLEHDGLVHAIVDIEETFVKSPREGCMLHESGRAPWASPPRAAPPPRLPPFQRDGEALSQTSRRPVHQNPARLVLYPLIRLLIARKTVENDRKTQPPSATRTHVPAQRADPADEPGLAHHRPA